MVTHDAEGGGIYLVVFIWGFYLADNIWWYLYGDILWRCILVAFILQFSHLLIIVGIHNDKKRHVYNKMIIKSLQKLRKL